MHAYLDTIWDYIHGDMDHRRVHMNPRQTYKDYVPVDTDSGHMIYMDIWTHDC